MKNALRLTLETIARELGEYADQAHGNPRSVRLTAATLREYAALVDEILAAEETAKTKSAHMLPHQYLRQWWAAIVDRDGVQISERIAVDVLLEIDFVGGRTRASPVEGFQLFASKGGTGCHVVFYLEQNAVVPRLFLDLSTPDIIGNSVVNVGRL